MPGFSGKLYKLLEGKRRQWRVVVRDASSGVGMAWFKSLPYHTLVVRQTPNFSKCQSLLLENKEIALIS